MSEVLPVVYVARHGNTAWTLSWPAYRPYRFAADPRWRAQRSAFGDRLKGLTFAKVFTSPLQPEALPIVVIYNRLPQNPNMERAPRTFFFAGKAAPAYRLAKVIM